MPSTPRVSPRRRSPTHDLALNIGGIYHVGLLIDPGDIQEVPVQASTLRLVTGGGAGNKFGPFDPTMAYAEQRNWIGGMGQENFSDDPERFFDARQCWTLTENKLLPTGLVVSGQVSGQRFAQAFMPGVASNAIQFKFIALTGAKRYYGYVFQISANYSADKSQFIVRRVGSPGTLTVELKDTSASDTKPGTTANKTVTKTVSDITDTLAEVVEFDWTTTQSLTATNFASIVIYGASTDTLENHWEIAVSPDVSDANISSDGTTWGGQVSNRPYYCVLDADLNREFFFFELDELQYAVTKNDSGAASQLYSMGQRGKATSSTASTLVDTNNTFSLGLNAVVKIINGTGAGQTRVVSSASSNTINVTPNWDINPDTTSEYVATGTLWREVGSTGLGVVTGQPAVVGSLPGVALFPQGATTIRRMRFDSSIATPAYEFANDVADDSDLLYAVYDPNTKVQRVWRARSAAGVSQIAKADAKAWGTSLTFETAIVVGNSQFPITGLIDYEGVLHVMKTDSIWRVEGGTTPVRLPVGLESSPHPNNGKAVAVHNKFLYFGYMHRWQRLLGVTVDDLGPKWGSGVGRIGLVSCVTTAFGWIFVGIDSGSTGQSCVLAWTGRAWHEVYRSPVTGARIRGIRWYHGHGVRRPMLLVGVGTVIDAVYFPRNSLNPLDDGLFPFNYQAVLTTSTFDFGSFHLPKFIKDLLAAAKNLTTGVYITVDYQVDADIGTTTWTRLGNFFQSPEDYLLLDLGNLRQIRFRLVLNTETYYLPVELNGYGVEGYARTPVKYQWTIKVKRRPVQLNRRGGRDYAPDDFYSMLKLAANGAMKVRVSAAPWLKSIHGLNVIVEPPTLMRQAGNNDKKSWAGTLTFVLRES